MMSERDSFVERLSIDLHAALDELPVEEQPWDLARGDIRRRRKQRRQRVLVPIVAAATAAVVAVVVLLVQPLGGHRATPVKPAQNPMRVVVAAAFGGTTPPKLAVGGGFVFAAFWDSGTVVKLDATSLSTLATLPVGPSRDGVLSMAYGDGALWLVNFADGRLWRVDPATMSVTAKVKLPAQPSEVAYGDGAVWVTACCASTTTADRQRLLRIDPVSGDVTGAVPIPGDGETVNLGVAADSVVVSSQSSPVSFVDPRSMYLQRQVPVRCGGCDDAPGLAATDESAYVSDGGSVIRLAVPSGRQVARSTDLSLTSATPFAPAPGELWAATADAVVGMDLHSLAVSERVDMAGASQLVVSGSSLIVATGGKVLRLSRQAAPTTPTSPPVDAAALHVAAPMIFGISGPAPLQQPNCRVPDVHASGQLVVTQDGIDGVVHFQGNHCSLRLHPEAAQLLDEAGRPLGVVAHADSTRLNPPRNPRPDLALAAGQAMWGFAWRGSWCGRRAASLAVPIHDPADLVARPNDVVVVPLSGPSLACHGRSSSSLVAGVFGNGDQPVLPPPLAWSALAAHLSAPARVERRKLTGLTLTLHNNSDTDVYLSPCPAYAITVGSTVQNGTEGDSNILPLTCSPGTTLVPPHGDVHFMLPPFPYDEGSPGNGALPGTRVTISVAIAGVNTATAVTTASS